MNIWLKKTMGIIQMYLGCLLEMYRTKGAGIVGGKILTLIYFLENEWNRTACSTSPGFLNNLWDLCSSIYRAGRALAQLPHAVAVFPLQMGPGTPVGPALCHRWGPHIEGCRRPSLLLSNPFSSLSSLSPACPCGRSRFCGLCCQRI